MPTHFPVYFPIYSPLHKLLEGKSYTPGHRVQGQRLLQPRHLRLVVLSPPGIWLQSKSLEIYQEGKGEAHRVPLPSQASIVAWALNAPQ